jgi:hypothetical protein
LLLYIAFESARLDMNTISIHKLCDALAAFEPSSSALADLREFLDAPSKLFMTTLSNGAASMFLKRCLRLGRG